LATLERDGAVFVLDLGDTENRFNADSLAELASLLDDVEGAEGPKALVVKATGKYWSNGLDLDWMMADAERAGPLLVGVHALYARVLVMPLPTVAAITGHAYAGGAMLSVAFDIKVMRVDRGYWCLPEVDLGLPFTPGMNALLVAKLPKRTAHESMTTARRYTAPEAETAGILDATAEETAVVSTAIERATALAGKASPALGEIKTRLYADAVDALAPEH
jgi:enoyl-CoA hydratase/carnithine racemase